MAQLRTFNPALVPSPMNGGGWSAHTVMSLPVALEPLTAEARWCVWRWWTTSKGKRTKVPHQAAWPDLKARTNDPATWGTYEQAIAAVEAGRADGIGFMLHGSEIAAFDLDDCRDPETGDVEAWAMEIVDQAASYCKITVSGTGLRIIGTAEGPHVHRKQRWPGSDGSVETYRGATRFIVVTGQELSNGSTGELRANIDSLIDDLVGYLDGAREEAAEPLFRGEPSQETEQDLPADLDRLVRQGVAEGERSDQFMHVVGWLKDRGWSADRIEALLSRHPHGDRGEVSGPASARGRALLRQGTGEDRQRRFGARLDRGGRRARAATGAASEDHGRAVHVDRPEDDPDAGYYGRRFIRRIRLRDGVAGRHRRVDLEIAEAMAMVSGRDLLGETPPCLSRVWYWNGEDRSTSCSGASWRPHSITACSPPISRASCSSIPAVRPRSSSPSRSDRA